MMPLIDRAKWYAALGYTPRLSQRLLDSAADSGKRFLGYFAMPRAGKSFGAAKHVGPSLLLPDYHIWIVAPNYQLGSKEFSYIHTDLAELDLLKHASSIHTDTRGGDMFISFPWGSFLQVVSADNPSSLRAEELDALILAEASALKPEIFERHLLARVEKRHGKVLVPTTPKGYNWVYEKFRVPSLEKIQFEYGEWKDGIRERLGGEPNPQYDPLFWSIVVSATEEYGDVLETGVYEPDTIQRARKLMPPEIFREQFGGDFSSYAGLIYHFDPAFHECEPFPIPDHWTHIVGYDAGANDPTAIMFGSYDPKGTLYWWGEIYTKGLSAAEYAALLKRMLGEKRPSAIMIDPSAAQVRIELSKCGVITSTPQHRQIEARITRMTALMRGHQFKVLKGTCPNFVRELYSWEWDENIPGKPRNGQSEHALDAAGYASLATVAFTHETDTDPDSVPNEDWRQERVWKPVRKFWREQAEEVALSQDEALLMENIFGEELDDDLVRL